MRGLQGTAIAVYHDVASTEDRTVESLFATSFPVIDAAPDVSARQRIEVLESLVAFNQTRQKQDKVRTFATRLEKQLRQVLSEAETAVVGNQLIRADLESRLGKCLANLERADEAEKLLLAAFNHASVAVIEADQMSKFLGRHIRKETVERLVEFYQLQGRQELGEAWERLGQLGSRSLLSSDAASSVSVWEVIAAKYPAEFIYRLNLSESCLTLAKLLLQEASSQEELTSE